MKKKVREHLVFLAMVGFLLAPVLGSAASLGFYNITANDPEDAAIGESQLWVDVTEAGAEKVAFTFNNDGPEACSITGVFFDDGTLLGVASIIEGPGVSFSPGSSPPNLPGWDTIEPVFETTAGFSADSDPPVQPDGVNPGEYLTLVFDLQSGGTFADVAEDLASGDLRIGIHVQGYASGGSESFVNNVPVCPDADGDGYGDPASPWCEYPELDCDDTNPQVNPGVSEAPFGDPICSDQVDNNCNGLIDSQDPGCRECTVAAECNDDNPCTDDDCVDFVCVYSNNTDPCDDGNECTANDVCADGACVGDPLDGDGDGYIAEECGGLDCDDTRWDVNPEATEGCCLEETCFDGIDNDCDGLIDSQEQACSEWCMAMGASTMGTPTGSGSRYMNYFAILLVPLATILIRRGMSRRR